MSALIVNISISDQNPEKGKDERIREYNFDMFVCNILTIEQLFHTPEKLPKANRQHTGSFCYHFFYVSKGVTISSSRGYD